MLNAPRPGHRLATTRHRNTVVITGASSGNGRATAHAFARQGARLVLAARGRAGLEATAAECEALGGEALMVPTDVSDVAAVEALDAAAIARFGSYDVWVNNAGVLQYGRFQDTPAEVVEQLVGTNLLGSMNGARVALRRFEAQGRGVLINTSSILAEVGHPYTAAYVATKFAIRGFTESLQAEMLGRPEIHVCAVIPAAIDTPIYQRAANYTRRRVRPIWALYPPETVARAVISLARRPRATAFAGGYGRIVTLAGRTAPCLARRATRLGAEVMELSTTPAAQSSGNVFASAGDSLSIDGGWRAAYRRAAAPGLTLALAGLALAALTLRKRPTN